LRFGREGGEGRLKPLLLWYVACARLDAPGDNGPSSEFGV